MAVIRPEVLTLGGQVFGLGSRGSDGRVLSQAQGIVEPLTIYQWPNDAVRDEFKLETLAVLTAHGKSEDESPSKWATWVFSYINLCFPEMKEKIVATGSREYRFVPLPLPVIETAHEFIQACQNASDESDTEVQATRTRLVLAQQLPSIELNETFFPPDLGACTTVRAMYGYTALLVYLAGKRVTEKNETAITEKRPDNLVRAYGITYDRAVLDGEGRMGTTAHHSVNQAWVNHAKAREAIITEVAAFASGTTFPQRVVHTISKMIENSGMQPAYYINKFLVTFPWAAQITFLRPAIEAYAQSLREVAAAPAHIQPYYKVIRGDSTRAFHRNSIAALSACAIAYEKHLTNSMVNFSLGPGANTAVTMFDAEATALGYPTIGELAYRVNQGDQNNED